MVITTKEIQKENEKIKKQALVAVNKLRVSLFQAPPLTKLLKGEQYNNVNCCIAKSLRYGAKLTSCSVSANEMAYRKASEKEKPHSKKLSNVLCAFIIRFDSGCYPELTKE